MRLFSRNSARRRRRTSIRGATKAPSRRGLKTLSPADRVRLRVYTDHRRTSGSFATVPYSLEYQGECARRDLLREASVADDPGLTKIFSTRARTPSSPTITTPRRGPGSAGDACGADHRPSRSTPTSGSTPSRFESFINVPMTPRREAREILVGAAGHRTAWLAQLPFSMLARSIPSS